MNTILSKKRILWADYAKFVAIYLVVLGHADLPSGDFRSFIYLFHLPLFFLISGYFDNSPKYNFKTFIVHNFKLLLVPYLCFNVINIPISWSSVYLHPELYPGIDSAWEWVICPLYGILLGDDRVTSCSYLPCGPLWFLVALFSIKVVFYFLRRVELYHCLIKYKYIEFFYWLICSLLFVALFGLLGKKIPYYSLDSMLLSMPFYMIGFLMKKKAFPIEFDRKFSYVLLIFIFAYIYIIGVSNGYVDIDAGIYGKNLILFYLNGFLGSYFVLLLCGLLTKPIKLVQYIGANTIIVLGVHLATLRVVKFLMLYGLGISVGSMTIVQSIIISVVSFFLCYPFIVFVDKLAPWMVGKQKKK